MTVTPRYVSVPPSEERLLPGREPPRKPRLPRAVHPRAGSVPGSPIPSLLPPCRPGRLTFDNMGVQTALWAPSQVPLHQLTMDVAVDVASPAAAAASQCRLLWQRPRPSP